MKYTILFLIFFGIYDSIFALNIPSFTFQDSAKNGQISHMSPRFHREDLKWGYVEFWWDTLSTLLHTRIYRYGYSACVESEECVIPHEGDDIVFFKNALWKETFQKMQDDENILIYGSRKRFDKPAYDFYNAYTEQQYIINSDKDQEISVRVFPINDKQFVSYEQELDYKYAHPIVTFIDPLYEYKNVRVWASPIITYKWKRVLHLSDIPEYRALEEKQKENARSSRTPQEKRKRFWELFSQLTRLLSENSDIQIQNFIPDVVFQKKYMITRFSAGDYVFPDVSGQFMYNDALVIVPYYEGKIFVHKGENTIWVDYAHFLPETGMLVN